VRKEERDKEVDEELEAQKAEPATQSGKIARLEVKLDSLGEAFAYTARRPTRRCARRRPGSRRPASSWTGSWTSWAGGPSRPMLGSLVPEGRQAQRTLQHGAPDSGTVKEGSSQLLPTEGSAEVNRGYRALRTDERRTIPCRRRCRRRQGSRGTTGETRAAERTGAAGACRGTCVAPLGGGGREGPEKDTGLPLQACEERARVRKEDQQQ
jgi:hypothetical protein